MQEELLLSVSVLHVRCPGPPTHARRTAKDVGIGHYIFYLHFYVIPTLFAYFLVCHPYINVFLFSCVLLSITLYNTYSSIIMLK